jgi:hypothetical protein
MDIHSIIDAQIDRGDSQGQLLYWDATTKRWTKTDEDELKWDENLVVLVIQGTVQTNRLLAGGIS